MKVPITFLHAGDVAAALNLTNEQAAQVTEEDLQAIASDMQDDYVSQLFWSQIRILAPRHLSHLLEEEEEEEEDDYTPDIY
jgi:hypothetical protein